MARMNKEWRVEYMKSKISEEEFTKLMESIDYKNM